MTHKINLKPHTQLTRDEDIYWKLRLLSYICKRRAQEKGRRLPASPHPPVTVKMACLVYRRSAGRLPLTLEAVEGADGKEGTVECGMELRWVGVSIYWMSGMLCCSFYHPQPVPSTITYNTHTLYVETPHSEEQVQASLSAMRRSFDQFAESFLALTKVKQNAEAALMGWLADSIGVERPSVYHTITDTSTSHPTMSTGRGAVGASAQVGVRYAGGPPRRYARPPLPPRGLLVWSCWVYVW